MILKPTEEDVPGDIACGNIVLIGKHAGCYYTHIDNRFLVASCCDDWTGQHSCSVLDDMFHPKVRTESLILLIIFHN